MENEFITVFCTYPTAKEKDAANSASTLIEDILSKKLAACVNKLPSISSHYVWKGKMEVSKEELWIIKTSRANFASLKKYISANHPYDCPEIIALPILEGNKDYINWLKENTNG